jgi:uncharacterized protein
MTTISKPLPHMHIKNGALKKIGTIAELWRYPVSSLGGEICPEVKIDPRGIKGDRDFALFDPSTGAVAAPEKDARWRAALFLNSTLGDDGKVHIHFPDGAHYDLSDPTLLFRLTRHFGFDVAVGQYAQTQAYVGSALPLICNRYDLSPLHLITDASVKRLAELMTLDNIDRRRFRPSIVLSTDAPALFLEDEWVGATLHFGDLKASVVEKTKRCGMTLIAQPELTEQPEILRTIVRQNGRSLGVYCGPSGSGELRVGSTVFME